VRVEWLILADYAEIIGNKLYVMGGGWDVLTVNKQFPTEQRCGLAASFVVPWNETNQRHHVEIQVATEDGTSIATVGAEFEVGRPPGIPPGQEQRFQIAGNLTLKLERAATYVVIGRVEGQDESRIHFNVVPGPMLRASPPPAGS
jgi:hypothetical protein